jgi:hypothetical protein
LKEPGSLGDPAFSRFSFSKPRYPGPLPATPTVAVNWAFGNDVSGEGELVQEEREDEGFVAPGVVAT